MTYYNTTNEKGQALEEYRGLAQSQDDQISAFFWSHPDQIYTPWEIQSLAFDPPAPPITSVRRAITSLTDQGVLEKTNILKEVGHYGRRSYAWKLCKSYARSIGPVVYDEVISQELCDELDEVLGHTEAIEQKISRKVTEYDLETGKAIERAKRPIIQGVLFETPKLEPVQCSICGRELRDPISIRKGVGPVCESKSCQS